LEEIPSNFMPFSSLNYLQASHAQLALEWSMLCQECTDCWTKDGEYHKVLTYIEYRAVPGVLRTIDPPSPLHPASVSSPFPKGWGYSTHSLGGEGVGGQ
jgi:hypothetical protein